MRKKAVPLQIFFIFPTHCFISSEKSSAGKVHWREVQDCMCCKITKVSHRWVLHLMSSNCLQFSEGIAEYVQIYNEVGNYNLK